jgi:hypothetical protein
MHCVCLFTYSDVHVFIYVYCQNEIRIMCTVEQWPDVKTCADRLTDLIYDAVIAVRVSVHSKQR